MDTLDTKRVSLPKTRLRRVRAMAFKIALALLAGVTLVAVILTLGVATGALGVHFPALTGRFAVGRANVDLVDTSRRELFGSDPSAHRAIVVTIYYPATPPANASPAPYLEGKMADALTSRLHLPAVAAAAVHSHAYDRPPVAAGVFPVVEFLPGIGTSPSEYTSLVEDLASHGYVVAMIYPTYSVPVTVFSDGRSVPLSEAGFRSENEPASASAAQIDHDRNVIGAVWVADARFTLDQLARLNGADALLRGHLDLERVGVFGHSFGGATAAEVVRIDPRFKAAINMDGAVFSMTDGRQIVRPLLWMASDYSQVTDSQLRQIGMSRAEFDTKVQQKKTERDAFLRTTPRATLITLPGSTHSTYITDDALIGAVLPGLTDPLATIDGTRALRIITADVATYFGHTV
jgi:predicted dienelactone hydrolase